jgi:hypothetical protein
MAITPVRSAGCPIGQLAVVYISVMSVLVLFPAEGNCAVAGFCAQKNENTSSQAS